MVLTRIQAKKMGLRHFNTGEACAAGHISDRYTSSGVCTECHKIKARGDAPPRRLSSGKKQDGRTSSLRYYYEHREERLKYRKALRQKHIETGRISVRPKSKKRSPEEIKEYHRARLQAWYRKNKERVFSNVHKRRAAIRGGEGKYTAKQISALLEIQRHRCAEPTCRVSIKKKFHRDHITPVALGGSSYISNIQLLCPTCNLRKKAKDPFVWALQNGRLL